MTGLDKFSRPDYPGETMLGTYLYPYRHFGMPECNNPYSATEVIRRATVEEGEVLVTRNGGLFTKPPVELCGIKDDSEASFRERLLKLSFMAKAARWFNRIICEFTLTEAVSEPTSPALIGVGKLVDGDHLMVMAASGGRDCSFERTSMAAVGLHQGTWITAKYTTPEVLEAAVRQECAIKLADISEIAPELVANAYFLFARGQFSEALVDAWVVIEQIIDRFWTKRVVAISNKDRVRRLKDARTYSAAVRLEILESTAIFGPDLCSLLHLARGHRNDLAHRAVIDREKAHDGLLAMKALVEFFCGKTVADPDSYQAANW
jgi:hypothetical protein